MTATTGRMLTVERLGVTYGGLHALAEVSLEVGAGEFVTIVGPNGAGKTTLLKAISGAVPAAEGRITYQGKDLARLRPAQRAALGIAHVPEGRRLFPGLTVLENLRLGGYLRASRAGAAQELERVLALLPLLRERRRQLAGTLSGGEQQLLAIGRALMQRPALLLLDEPSQGLAPRMVGAVLDLMTRIRAQGVSVLLVEQNVRRALGLAHHGYVLESGRIVLQGRGAELAEHPKVRRAYLGL